MKKSALKLMVIAGIMVSSACLTVNATPVKVAFAQESRDTLRKGKTDTAKKDRKTKNDTTGTRPKVDTVSKL